MNRFSNPFEFARALLLRDKEPGDLPLHACGDQDRAGFRGCLDARGYIRRFAEHLPGRVNHDQAALEADTSGQLRHAFRGVSCVEIPKGSLDGQCSPDAALGVILLRLWITEQSHQPVAELLQHMPAKSGHRL